MCPRANASNQAESQQEIEEPKVCEFGAFQDYRMKHARTELVTLDRQRKHVLVNRTWLELPDLKIPVHSDAYCVRMN